MIDVKLLASAWERERESNKIIGMAKEIGHSFIATLNIVFCGHKFSHNI